MRVTRRNILKTGTAALLAGTFGVSPTPAWAQSVANIGSIKIDVLSDGYLKLPVNFVLPDVPKDELEALLVKYNMPTDSLEPACNLTLVRDGERTILFDVGSGPNFMPSSGKLADAMAAIELDPSEVTHVVFTHAHPDHLWGLLDDFDELVFSEAEYMMSAPEWDFWINPATVDLMSEARKAFAVGARRNLALLEEKITRFNYGEEILPGIQALDTNGHTPGHTAFEVRSGSESLLVLGDAITNHAISFEKPDWPSGSDQNAEQGIKTRKMLLDRMASEQIPAIGYHLPKPGIGRAEAKNGAYRYVAA